MRLRQSWAAIIVPAALASSVAADDREAKMYQLPQDAQVIAIHPDSRTVACLRHADIWLLDLETGKNGPILSRHDSCRSLRFTPNGKSLLLAGPETVIRPLDPVERDTFQIEVPLSRYQIKTDSKGMPIFSGVVGPGLALPQMSADGKRVFAHTQKSDIAVWDIPTEKWVKTLPGTGKPVNQLTVSPDGERLLVATPEDLSSWDLTTWKQMFTKKWPRNEDAPPSPGATTILFLPKSRTGFCVASAKIGDDEPKDNHDVLSFYTLDADTGACRLLARSSPLLKRCRVAVLSADGKYAFLGRDSGTLVHVIETATGKEVATYLPMQLPVWNLAVTPDGKHLLIGGMGTKLLRVPIPVLLAARPLSTYQEFKDEYQRLVKP